jgi:hypothetical protein
MPRFNHMELTLPKGGLTDHRADITKFYTEVFGFEALDIEILKQTGLLLRTDSETSQFILVTEQRKHLTSPGFDHLGFLYDTRAEVDSLLEECQKRQEQDPRLELKLYDDLKNGGTTVRAFYVRYLLPIWFDIQCIEYAADSEPARKWTFG